MKIDRNTFVAILEKLAPILGNNPLVPGDQYFQIEGKHIQVTNGRILVDLICSIDTGLHCSVPKEVLDLLSSLSAEEVDLEVKEDELRVRTNKIKGKFSVLTPPTFKPLPEVDTEKGARIDPLLLNDVIDGLGFCRFGVSKDAASGPYCGVQINGSKIFSTDTFRVVQWNLKEDLGLVCTVPVRFIDVLKRCQRDVESLTVDVNKGVLAAALADGTRVFVEALLGDYPKLAQYFSCSGEYEQVRFGDKLAPIIERHSSLLKNIDALDRIMLIEIEDGVCTLTSEVPEKANLVEQIDVETSKNFNVAFTVNPTFLREVATRSSSFKFFPEISAEGASAGLILFESEKFQYLMRSGRKK